MPNRYAQRDEILKEMGFASYAAYLASPLWGRVRARLFRVCDKCVCGEPATQFHHLTYKRKFLEGRGGKIHKYIVPLCRKCHHFIEFEDGKKVPMGRANARLEDLRAEYESRGIRAPSKARLNGKSLREKKKLLRDAPLTAIAAGGHWSHADQRRTHSP